jgi:DNA repair protein RadA/Sms
MAKATVNFVCTVCGAVHAKWSGRCSNCGGWNTLEQQVDAKSGEAAAAEAGNILKSRPITDIKLGEKYKRLSTGLSEVDLVLGGGIVPASVILLAGEPGIGKSTLLTQLASHLAKDSSVLYVSAEESAEQIFARAQRLGATNANFNLASSTSADDIIATMHDTDLGLVIVDSVQTVATEQAASAAGSPSQISTSAQLLIRAAKLTNTALILVGHVTKEGSIAGPKLLEHLVDVVLNLEGDRYGGFKLLRGVKNRYGSTNEAGVFEMTEAGLKPVDNPSAALLKERQVSDGSVVLATIEGTRPLLVEVQALVNKTAFGYPKRAASGFDLNRLNLLIAMLGRRTKLNLSEHDVYVNIVGGMRIAEPAADLAVCMAVASAAKGMQLKTDAVVFGEVGLSGEVRHVQMADARIAEAKKLGFKAAIGPKLPKASSFVHSVSTVREGLNTFLSKD